MSAIAALAIVGIALTLFFGVGGVEALRSRLPKDLKESISDAVGGGSIVDTRSDDLIPESSTKQDTKELTDKITLTPEQEKSLPTSSTIPTNAQTNLAIPSGFGSLNEQETQGLTKEQQKGARIARELTIPQELKRDTSLAGSIKTQGPQFKRGSETARQIQQQEAERAAQSSLILFGNIQNPKFVKTPKPQNTTTITQKKIEQTAAKTLQPTNLEIALSKKNTSAEAKRLLEEAQAKRK